MRIPNRQAKLNALMASQFTKEARQAEVNGPQRRKVVALADDEIIANLRKAKNSSKFERLFDHGDTGEYDQDEQHQRTSNHSSLLLGVNCRCESES